MEDLGVTFSSAGLDAAVASLEVPFHSSNLLRFPGSTIFGHAPKLDCYWVGSLDLNFWVEIKECSTKPPDCDSASKVMTPANIYIYIL